MTWLLAILLAAGAFIGMNLLLRAPRSGREAIAAALMAGLAGYAFQASPDVSAAPRAAPAAMAADPALLVRERMAVAGKAGLPGDKWLVIGDALARNGQYADAAGVLLGAVEHDPGNGEAWLALGNALVAHADGTISPAASFAFRQAAQADPQEPGPPFFLGLALAQSGQFIEARSLWAELMARTPPDAPWRADLQDKLGRLDALIRQQEAAAQQN